MITTHQKKKRKHVQSVGKRFNRMAIIFMLRLMLNWIMSRLLVLTCKHGIINRPKRECMATNEIGILNVILESIVGMTIKNILQQHCVTLG